MQTKTMSIVEIVSSKTVGFLVALAVTFWIVPAIWGVTVGAESAIYVTGIYTGVAVIRSYLGSLRDHIVSSEAKNTIGPQCSRYEASCCDVAALR